MSRPLVLIPAHNRRALTLRCLAALRANGDLAACEAVVIDDGSTDGTSAAIRQEFPEVRLLSGDGHLYWTGAIALAMEDARTRGAPGPVFWLNDDCRPRPGALAALAALLTATPNAVVGPRCVDTPSGRTIPTGFIGRTKVAAEPGETKSVAGLSGYCVGLGAGAWQKLGAPDARNFPHYAGDTAYTLRASRAGLPVLLLGAATVELLDYGSGPVTPAARVRGAESLPANWHRIFFATNSPHRLRTLFALLRLKYGFVAGTLLALSRTATWTTQVLLAKARGPRL